MTVGRAPGKVGFFDFWGGSFPLTRVLIVRLSAIGDCVMSVPVAASIRSAIPDAEIWWAVEPRCEAVLENKRLVNHKALFDREGWKNQKPGPKVWRDQLLAYRRLRQAHFDYGIDLQGHFKTALALRFANPRKRIAATAHDALARSLNPIATGDPSSMHTVEWNLHSLAQLGHFDITPNWIMPGLESERCFVQGKIKDRPLVSIAVSAGQPAKVYPLERWEQIGKAILERGHQVVFLGGPGDPIPKVEGALNWVGQLSLSQTMAAVALSGLHLAADTGTGHIAAAYGVPTVSIFGPTSVKQFRPYSDLGTVLREGDDPAAVSVSSVMGAVERTLKKYE